MSGSFFAAWIAGGTAASAFLEPRFRDPRARREAVESAALRAAGGMAEDVRAALVAQDELHPQSEARRRNLEALIHGEAAAVVTGQQVGLFLGPLYTFYKAASAVAVARALEAESGPRVVPLFWLQTEDHDFAEIDHCVLPNPKGPPIELRLLPDDARISVAHRRLGEDVLPCLEGLDRAVGGLPYAAEVSDLFRRAYQPGRSMAGAFAFVLAELFREEGLVILDPRDERMARASIGVLGRAIEEAEAIGKDLFERSRALERAGFRPQVHVREDACLVFHHEGSALGPRTRPPAGRDVAELTATLTREPLRFSTSALLRPLVQDTLLSTAAYVGGPAEATYFAQLDPLYRRFGVKMPLLVPRARFRVIDERSRTNLHKLGLAPAEVEKPEREFYALAGRALAGPGAELRAKLLGHLEADFAPLAEEAIRLDPTLKRPAEKTRAAMARALDTFFGKWDRARVEKERISSERVERLRGWLFPGGQPQERLFALPYFIARWGMAGFKDQIMRSLSPFAAEIEDVFP